MSATENYLRDTLLLLIDRARDAKAQRDNGLGDDDAVGDAFRGGRATAYHEVISTMLGQMEVFGLSRSAFSIPQEFEPDRDLL